jgi:hypothetical protein
MLCFWLTVSDRKKRAICFWNTDQTQDVSIRPMVYMVPQAGVLRKRSWNIWFAGADPDVLDGFGGTPIMYAMQLPAPHDWEIMELLIEGGADPCYGICIGGVSWLYPDIAKAMGKLDLAKLLEEAIVEMPEDEETDVTSRC